MVAVDPSSRPHPSGLFLSTRALITSGALIGLIVFLQAKSLFSENTGLPPDVPSYDHVPTSSISALRTVATGQDGMCKFYLAESAIPNGGLGLFSAMGLHPGDMVGFPDICIFVSDPPKYWTHLRSHSWGPRTFFGQYEGRNSRAACEGFVTIFNTAPDHMINSEIGTPVLPTNAGLDRAKSPGAGSITHHFGIHAVAKNIITAGSELTAYYGDWDFSKEDAKNFKKPERPVPWLEKHGWCVDNIRISQSTLPHAGRGAYARRALKSGEVVAPAPLQCFQDRSVFQNTKPEQLFVNYCLQAKDSSMLFYPYGPSVNLINHHSKKANVRFQWSENNLNHKPWLDLSYDQFWEVTYPGGMILEVVALRDIRPGEELFLDYGSDWEKAWREHLAKWKPPADADEYVYPQDMDETSTLRTVKEQESDPYPANVATMCTTPDWERENGNNVTWTETEWEWWQGMVFCHILDRRMGPAGDYVYDVSIVWENDPDSIEYNPNVPADELYVDFNVPRKAIRFIEKPYADDEHLRNSFRHPIGLPDDLFPEQWKLY